MLSKLDIEFMDNTDDCFSMQEKQLEEDIIKSIKSNNTRINFNTEFYLNQRRLNLIKWYPINGRILELGAGFGTFTEYLSSQATEVVAVEMKKERYNILRKKCAICSNIRFYNGNFKELEFNEKFNYIFIHDIVGFLRKYYKTSDYMIKFLDHMYDLLDVEGTLLIECENKYGIKYFAGSIEEYSKRQYTSLLNFNQYDYIRSFSKSEWEYMLNICKFKTYKFYYPFPDNNYISEMQTDYSLKYFGFSNTFRGHYPPNYGYFSYHDMLSRYNEIPNAFFSNVFFIEISKKECKEIAYCDFKTKELYYKYDESSYIFQKKRMDTYISEIAARQDLLGKCQDIDYLKKLIQHIYDRVNPNNRDNHPMTFRDVFVHKNYVSFSNQKTSISLEQFKDIIGSWYCSKGIHDRRIKLCPSINIILNKYSLTIDFSKYLIDDIQVVNPIKELPV